MVILNEPEFLKELKEITDVISFNSDIQLINKHQSYGANNIENTPKSLSKAINDLLKEGLVQMSLIAEAVIFQDTNYQGDTWRLDFAKKIIVVR